MGLTPQDILTNTAHRSDAIAPGRWRYYQEWKDAVFLHWKVDADTLQTLLPQGLQPDTFQGQAWVSLVAFTMDKIRPRGLPAWTWLSTFHEINIRTYVRNGDQSGVYFLSIEAEKSQSVVTARLLSGLPYEKADIKRTTGRYQAHNKRRGFALDLHYEPGLSLVANELDNWLCERYGLYVHRKNELCYFPVHHLPWSLQTIRLSDSLVQYGFENIVLDRAPDLAHYSPGVQVLAWPGSAVR